MDLKTLSILSFRCGGLSFPSLKKITPGNNVSDDLGYSGCIEFELHRRDRWLGQLSKLGECTRLPSETLSMRLPLHETVTVREGEGRGREKTGDTTKATH